RRPEVDDDDLALEAFHRPRLAGRVDVADLRQALVTLGAGSGVLAADRDLARVTGEVNEQEDENAHGARQQDADQRFRTHRNLKSDDSRSSGGTNPSSSMQVAVTFAIPAVFARS